MSEINISEKLITNLNKDIAFLAEATFEQNASIRSVASHIAALCITLEEIKHIMVRKQIREEE